MTTADVVRDRALSLAGSGTELEEAVRELEATCEGRRVAVVRARQQLAASLEGESDAATAGRAVELLDELLGRLPA